VFLLRMYITLQVNLMAAYQPLVNNKNNSYITKVLIQHQTAHPVRKPDCK
jgi:hypothetical protein